MNDKEQRINNIPNRQYILSPTVEKGDDRECSNKDFYQDETDLIDIGKMGFAARVIHSISLKSYLIMNFEKNKVTKPAVRQMINKTLKLMYSVKSPYLLRLMNHYEDESNVFFIFQNYEGETLEAKINKDKCNRENIIQFAKEVCVAILCLNENNMFNINIAPENILIGDYAMLTDYGIKLGMKSGIKPPRETKVLKSGNSQHILSSFTSPEELKGIQTKKRPKVSTKTDSWNVGILLFEMCTKFQSAFNDKTKDELAEGISNANANFELIEDDFFRDIIKKFLKSNPEERLGIKEFLEMEEIKNVDIPIPLIEESDFIINKNDYMEEEEQQQINQIAPSNAYEYDDMLNSLQFENEDLKKKIEKIELKMSLKMSLKKSIKHQEKMNLSYKEKKSTDNNNDLKRALTIEELEDKEKKLNEELMKIEQEDFPNEGEEKEKNDDDDEVDENDLNLQLQKLKTKYTFLKMELKEEKEKEESMSEELSNLKIEKENLDDTVKKNEMENIEVINLENKKNIEELSEKLESTVLSFHESQQEFMELIQKIIAMTPSNYEVAIAENKVYIDAKMKIIFEIAEKFSQKLKEEKDYNEYEEEIANEFFESPKNLFIKSKIEELKKIIEQFKVKESEEKKVMEELETYKKKEDENKIEIQSKEKNNVGLLERIEQIQVTNNKLEEKLNDMKKFIIDNCSKEEQRGFFEELNLEFS